MGTDAQSILSSSQRGRRVSKSEIPPKVDEPKKVVEDRSSYRADFPKSWPPPPRSDIADLTGGDEDEFTIAYSPSRPPPAPSRPPPAPSRPPPAAPALLGPDEVAPKVATTTAAQTAPAAENPRKLRDRWRDSKASIAFSRALRDSKAGIVVSRTLRPVAARLGSFSLAYPISIVALTMSGTALYLSRTVPPDYVSDNAAHSTSDDTATPEAPQPGSAAATGDAPPAVNTLDPFHMPPTTPSAAPFLPRNFKATPKSAPR
jgi:hypothetical protein